jgi:hypothetical protein
LGKDEGVPEVSKIDPEVLYLILTKVASREAFYTYDPARLPTGQSPGTVSPQQLGELYERITGNRVGASTKWSLPLDQLDLFLGRCKLPPLSPLLSGEPEGLKRAQAAKWPGFGALKKLYRA